MLTPLITSPPGWKPGLGVEPDVWRPFYPWEATAYGVYFFQEGAGNKAWASNQKPRHTTSSGSTTEAYIDLRASDKPSWVQGVWGNAAKFDGTNDAAFVRPPIGGATQITIETIVYWDAFANDDKLLFEFTSNYNNNAGAFIVNPNSSGGGGAPSGFFQVNFKVPGAGAYNGGHFTRPSAAVFHHYVFTFDLTVGTALATNAYVDGVAQSMTQDFSNTTSGGTMPGVPNDTEGLNIFSRNAASLFGAGRMAKLAVYRGILDQAQVNALYRDPYASLRPRGPRIWMSKSSVQQLTMTAATGMYGLTGEAMTPAVGMPSSQGSYTVTGNPAVFNITMPAATGSYTLTGNAATLPHVFASLVANTGFYTVTGKPATFPIVMPATTGYYIVTGPDVNLEARIAHGTSNTVLPNIFAWSPFPGTFDNPPPAPPPPVVVEKNKFDRPSTLPVISEKGPFEFKEFIEEDD